jgi:hypothetical protein
MQATLTSLPQNISRNALSNLRDDILRRETMLQAMINRFETKYGMTLDALESRLAQGKGQEHPDWEDSIEWLNAQEELQRADLMKSVLEWLLRSKTR